MMWSRGTQRSKLSGESGQILPLLAAGGLVVLLGIAALVLDVGHAQLVRHRLQSAADAAALAGAQELYSNPDNAPAVAAAFSARGKNAPGGGDLAGPATITAVCSRPGASCAKDTLVVSESAEVKSTFAKVVGIDSFHVGAKAAACGPCSGLPLDVMILLDRTASMSDGDMANAQRGIETLLRYLNPRYHRVGFAVTPPAASMRPPYDPVTSYVYPAGTDQNYVLVPLTTDYKRSDGSLDTSSPLVSAIEHVWAGGTTSYALALEQASAALDSNPRFVDGKPVHKVLIFMSDGAANTAQLSAYPDPRFASPDAWLTGPAAPSSWSPYITEPCGKAVDVAKAIQGPDPKKGTEIFTIGYGIDDSTGDGSEQCYEAPHYAFHFWVGFRQVREPMTAREALKDIASPEKDHFVEPAQGQDLRNIFADIAGSILPPKLVPVPPGT